MSNNDKNGGLTPAESQDASAEQNAKLLDSIKNLPFDALAKLPFEVREAIAALEKLPLEVSEAILAGRKSVDAERDQLNAERAQLNAERQQLAEDKAAHAAAIAKHDAEVLSQLKALMAVAQQAHEREASQNLFIAEVGSTMARLEAASTESRADQAKTAADIIDRLDSMREAAALAHDDQMRLSTSISNAVNDGFSAIGAQNDQLQVSVDRIGEMMNRLHDFILNVRDGIIAFQSEFLNFKKTFGEFNISFRKEVRERFDSLPEKFGLRIQDIRKVIADLNGAAKGLIERSNKFAEQQEDHISTISDRIDDLGSLYTNHTRRLNSGLEDQMKLAKSTLANGVDGLLGELSEVFKKSEVFKQISEIHKMAEELNHAQAGLTKLLHDIQEEKENLVAEIQEAKDAFKANAKDINESMSSVMDDKRRVMSELSDAMRVVKGLLEDLERMRADVVRVAGSVEKISNVATSGAMATGEFMIQQFQGINAKQQVEVLEAVKHEGLLTRNAVTSTLLGGSQEEA